MKGAWIMKSFITFDKIGITDADYHFNWAYLHITSPAEDSGSDCSIDVEVRVPKEQQNIDTIRTYALSKTKEFLASAVEAEYVDGISKIPWK